MDGSLSSNCTSLEQEYILIQSREEYILLQVQPEVGMDEQQRHHFTSRRSRGVCEATNWPAARDDSVVNRPKQAVRQGKTFVMQDLFF